MRTNQHQAGLTMVELMVALAIGSFLIIGAIQIYAQSRHAFVINESIARVQETALFAMDTIEADLRMASNWGRNSRALAVEGRSLEGNVNPKGLPAPAACGADWALDLAMFVDGENNAYALPCGAMGGAQANSDVVTVRRVTVAPSVLEPGRLQVQSTRIQGELFADGVIPPNYTAADSSTHNLLINSYYVSAQSDLIPGAPTLRRKSLTSIGGVPTIVDQEVAPGVENLQIQFGVDVNGDNSVDRYVNPGDPVYDPAAVGYIPGARIITARIWLVIRGITREVGITDLRDYEPGDVDLGVYNDAFRRMQVSKTILMRNARS
jgi:type IV pilus assembly protein PilW